MERKTSSSKMMPLYLLLLWISCDHLVAGLADYEVVDMDDRDQYNTKLHPGYDFRIFCHSSSDINPFNLFQTLYLHLDITNFDFTQYEGADPVEVYSHYEERKSIFSLNLFSQKKTWIKLDSFNRQCVGIETKLDYVVRMHLIRVDFRRVVQLLLGLLMFKFAGKLSTNSVFYYMTGVIIGICTSFILLFYLAGKLFPKRPLMYGLLVGAWGVGVLVFQHVWQNLQWIIITYQTYVLWYIFISGFISFMFCYRLGPPKNKRSKDIIKWSLQTISLTMIYFAPSLENFGVVLVIGAIATYYFPSAILSYIRVWYCRKFPAKRRLLTSEEFYEEGVRETTKALDDLRSFCSSPECNSWKLMTKLKDPMRFAQFVEGNSHILDDEVSYYESSRPLLSESDSEEEDGASSNHVEPLRSTSRFSSSSYVTPKYTSYTSVPSSSY